MAGSEFEFLFQSGLGTWGFVLLVAGILGLSAYVRIATVLGIVRVGLGWNSAPGAFVVGVLSIALSFLVMAPTLREASHAAQATVRPGERWSDDSVRSRAFSASLEVWRKYLLAHSSSNSLDAFSKVASEINSARTPGIVAPAAAGSKALPDNSSDNQSAAKPAEPVQDSWQVAAPAFIVTQLQSAFSVGLRLFLPLLLIDLLVASVMLAFSAEQLSPQLVAFPLKLLLFVAVDGWALITTHLVSSSLSGP